MHQNFDGGLFLFLINSIILIMPSWDRQLSKTGHTPSENLFENFPNSTIGNFIHMCNNWEQKKTFLESYKSKRTSD